MKEKIIKTSHFAVCISNEDYKASLEVGKLYWVIPDEEASSHGYIRVIDESGEDYGYAADRFFPLEIPQALVERTTDSWVVTTGQYTHTAKYFRIYKACSSAIHAVHENLKATRIAWITSSNMVV